MKNVLLTLAFLWVLINVAAPFFDGYCVAGRLSATQAWILNRTTWEKQQLQAGPNDRVIREECSEFSRRIFRVLW